MSERVCHLDCRSGLAGDMFLGACLEVGLPLSVLEEALERLGLDGVQLEARPSRRHGLAGTRFRVLQNGAPIEGPDPDEGAELPAGPRPTGSRDDDRHRAWREIRRLIADSGLDPAVRERALALFARLAEVEAKRHGVAVDDVHFHEVGAIDSIVDLVGAAAAMEWLAPGRVTCSTVVVGGGSVETAHGVMPIPAPATAELLVGVPIEAGPVGELVTPTGALILEHWVDDWVEAPEMVIESQGWGLGRWELADRPNGVRLLVGRGRARRPPGQVAVLECEVDDLSGEGFGFLMERLLEEGALDAYLTPVQMKKGRPGVLVTALTAPEDRERLAAVLLSESGSLGCRFSHWQRVEAERETVSVETEYGGVRVKRGRLGGRPLVDAPEYEDCRLRAREHGVTWRRVYRAALEALEATDREPIEP